MERTNPGITGTTTPSGPATTDARWTTRRLLAWMAGYFAEKHVDSPRVVADMLLGHVLECERMRLYMDADREASPEELTTLRELVRRAGLHEPVQYLIGDAWFFTRPFAVNPSTLIPRPSTETLVEYVLQWCHRRNQPDGGMEESVDAPVEADVQPKTTGEITFEPIELDLSDDEDDEPSDVDVESHPMVGDEPIETAGLRIADIGTGTGCIAVSLAAQLPHATFIVTDIVPEALELAKANAERHGVADRIEFRLGDGLSPLNDAPPMDILCSNPPYIPDHEWDAIAPNVREYEPATALRAGSDGLDVIRPMIAALPDRVAPGGLIAIEIAACQCDDVIRIARDTNAFRNVRVVNDLEGHPRVLLAERA